VRITGGNLRGKKLSPLRGLSIRPTTDYLRESIFNILVREIEGSTVLDLYAGTGSLGIEALSRGAEKAVFVDKAAQAIKAISQNLKTCALEERSRILRRDILRGLGYLKPMIQAFDLVFMDPPYDKGFCELTLKLLDRARTIAEGASIVVEHSSREILPAEIAGLVLSDRRQYGKTLVSFYRPVL
jgi:16S rRNA (guanine966-N2)-methyltransferase